MVIFGQTGETLDPKASKGIIMSQFAVGAAVSVLMVLWRFTKLKESAVWKTERADCEELTQVRFHLPCVFGVFKPVETSGTKRSGR